MTSPLHIVTNPHFTARALERKQLQDISVLGEAAIIVVYGRRRVGKTELLEQTYARRNILKFEGIEGADAPAQKIQVLRQLAQYTGEPHLADLRYESWIPVFELIAKYVMSGLWTVYFEEVQWLANYKQEFIAELKFVWDNYFRHNPKLKLILCGSSPSFMIKQVLHSKALYNRSIYEIPLQEFSVNDVKLLLPKRQGKELMDAYLTVGGIPEYMKRINQESSLFLGICKNAFTKGGYLANECQRIFVSSLSDNKHYKLIINYLAKKRFATRKEIAEHLGISTGGQLTELLSDLTLCGFIGKYVPYNQKPNSYLVRYCIQDYYLNFYFKFIDPILGDVAQGDYASAPTAALDLSGYQKWLGYAFERFCRKNHRVIAALLGFSAIKYRHGAYFSRKLEAQSAGFQIDLIFERADRVLTICEVRYLNSKVDTAVIQEFEDKLKWLDGQAGYSIQRVLITTEGATDALLARAYFDRIILLADFFQ